MNGGASGMLSDTRPHEGITPLEQAAGLEAQGTLADSGGRDDIGLNDTARTDILSRLGRIEGQARGIRRMVEEGRPCDEVVIQLAALKAAVAQAGIAVASSHLLDCVSRTDGASGDDRAAVARFVRIFSKLS